MGNTRKKSSTASSPAVPIDPEDRFLLYAGKGRTWPEPLKDEDLIGSYFSAPAARAATDRLYQDYDWWIIFDIDTNKFFSTWSTGRTTPELRGK